MTDYISRQAAIDFIDTGHLRQPTELSWSDHDVKQFLDNQPTADVRENITAHKVIGGGEHDGATCWFECDNCGLAVDIGDVFCKHCGARFVP